MRVLSLSSLDATTELACIEDGVCQLFEVFPSSSRLSESLWDALRALLNKVNWTLDMLDCFACVRGPGSYTSLRVGLAAMNGLAWSTEKPVIGFLVEDLNDHPAAEDLPRAVQCGLLAHDWLLSHSGSRYTGPVMPEYGAEFQLGRR